VTDGSKQGNNARLVWILDDSRTEAAIARHALLTEYSVEVFHDGSEVLEQLAARRPPDVLVLDWVMPGLSGIEVCEFVRNRPETHDLPILLLTNNQRSDQVVQGLDAGANDYLSKPYAAPELRARVGALIRSLALRQRAEAAEGRLRRVLAQVPDAVVTFDSQSRIVFGNARMAEMLGLPPESLEGLSLHDVLPGLKLESLAVGHGRHGTLPDLELFGRTLSPQVSIPPGDDEGNTTVTLRDVTETRQRESRRVDFYSMVAHDLRSPLSALQMRAMMLLQGMRGAITPEVRGELEKMVARVRELVQTVNDFLDIAQMESARFAIEHAEIDLAPLCADVYDEYRPVALSRGLELSVSAEPGAKVLGDSRRLTQVIGNLVSNSLKFTPAGGRVAIELNSAPESVSLEVQDTGRGISPEVQGRLFTKYERVGGTAAARIEGTGLGLVIVKEIIEAHGGEVGVRSREGQGSIFWFKLPRAPAQS
jgi:two-component system phosphate regulon sensor histidine kinase PhoR